MKAPAAEIMIVLGNLTKEHYATYNGTLERMLLDLRGEN